MVTRYDRTNSAFVLPAVVLHQIVRLPGPINDVLKSPGLITTQKNVVVDLNVAGFNLQFQVATRSPIEDCLKILILEDGNRRFQFPSLDNSKPIEKGQWCQWWWSNVVCKVCFSRSLDVLRHSQLFNGKVLGHSGATLGSWDLSFIVLGGLELTCESLTRLKSLQRRQDMSEVLLLNCWCRRSFWSPSHHQWSCSQFQSLPTVTCDLWMKKW